MAVEARLLDDRADPGEGVGAPVGNREPEHLHRSLAGRGQAEQHTDQGGLAGAVRTEEPEGAAARDGQVGVVDGNPLAEALG